MSVWWWVSLLSCGCGENGMREGERRVATTTRGTRIWRGSRSIEECLLSGVWGVLWMVSWMSVCGVWCLG